jgi:hypothetical protein
MLRDHTHYHEPNTAIPALGLTTTLRFLVPGFGPVSREGPVVDGQHRLLKPRPPALLALVCSAMITTGA